MDYFFFGCQTMVRRWKCLLISATFILTDSCSPPDRIRISDLSYFPLRVGNFQIYQVSETDFQNTSCSDTSEPPTKIYELKVVTYDSTKNAEDGYTYLIHRYTRSDSTQRWEDLDTWSARVTSNRVIVNEGNTPYVKMVFPLVDNSAWNGNLYNNLKDPSNLDYGIYHVKNLGRSYQLSGGKKYSNTLTVIQADNRDFVVTQDKGFEVYAPSVGLIYREITHLEYLQPFCPGRQTVASGIIYFQTLKSTGRE